MDGWNTRIRRHLSPRSAFFLPVSFAFTDPLIRSLPSAGAAPGFITDCSRAVCSLIHARSLAPSLRAASGWDWTGGLALHMYLRTSPTKKKKGRLRDMIHLMTGSACFASCFRSRKKCFT